MRLAAVFVADEVGALANRYPIDSMESSQMGVKNRTGILISTAYESLNNPMTQEVDKAQNSLLRKEGAYDPALFSLLYKPDYPGKWMTSDDELLKANPLAVELSDNFNFIKKKRQNAINNPLERKNFLTKHMNIFINGEEAETFLTKDQVDKVVAKNPIDWRGREVYVGLDLSETSDNTSVAMVAYDEYENKFYTKAWAFYPKLKENYKSKVEKVEYADMTEKGYSFGCGNAIIDYEFIENFVMDLESNYGVTIKGIGYDRWNARSSISKFSNEGFDCMEIKQTNEGLYPGTKLLKEAILSEHFLFDENLLLRMNLLNARTVTNTNMSYHLGKKQSDGKIDMAAAIVDSMALWNDEIDDNALRGNSGAITILGE